MTLIKTVADIVAAYVGHNATQKEDVTTILNDVYRQMASLGSEPSPEMTQAEPMSKASWKKSISAAGLISYEDGKVYQTLTRHLTARGMTMREYRAKWGLPHDYPAVHPDYSRRRSELALERGLGRNPAPVIEEAVHVEEPVPVIEEPAPEAKSKAAPKTKAVRSFPKSEQTRRRAKRPQEGTEPPQDDREAA